MDKNLVEHLVEKIIFFSELLSLNEGSLGKRRLGRVAKAKRKSSSKADVTMSRGPDEYSKEKIETWRKADKELRAHNDRRWAAEKIKKDKKWPKFDNRA